MPPVVSELADADDDSSSSPPRSGPAGAAAGEGKGWRHFANVLKGFIGSNYLAVPFAFTAAGMLLGPLAVVAVAAISGACVIMIRVHTRPPLSSFALPCPHPATP